MTAGLRDDRDCLRLTATRESTSLINAVTGHVKSDQIHLSGYAGDLNGSTQHSTQTRIH